MSLSCVPWAVVFRERTYFAIWSIFVRFIFQFGNKPSGSTLYVLEFIFYTSSLYWGDQNWTPYWRWRRTTFVYDSNMLFLVLCLVVLGTMPQIILAFDAVKLHCKFDNSSNDKFIQRSLWNMNLWNFGSH